MKTKHGLLLAVMVTSGIYATVARAQGSVQDAIKGSVSDANTLVNGYVSPALTAIGYGLNQGWYNTAKPHKVLGIDVTATINFMKIPTSAATYYIDNSKLNTIERLTGPGGNPQSGNVPTIFGSNIAPSYGYKPNGTPGFSGAPGTDLSGVPVIQNSLPIPMAQLGLGLPKGFELKFRYVPTINFGNNQGSNFNLFGVGLMHDVKRYIPGIKLLPFDLSGFVGYTKMTLNAAFDSNHPDQIGTLSSSATTIQGVISKKLAVLTAYAGLGYNFAKTKISVTGNYDLGNGTYVPVQLGASANSTGPRMTAGLRLKLAIFTFHGEYTLQKYSALTLGFGLSIR